MAKFRESQTARNLMVSFAGEPQAPNRYTYFARRAAEEGFMQIAHIFEETAEQEFEHPQRRCIGRNCQIYLQSKNGQSQKTKHLGLWETNTHDPPAQNPSRSANEPITDDPYSQIPPIDYWLQ